MFKQKTSNPTTCRLWMDSKGLLHIFDLDRSLHYDVYPLEYQKVDLNGVPEVLKTFSNKLSKDALARLSRFLERKNLVPKYNCVTTDLFVTSCMNS